MKIEQVKLIYAFLCLFFNNNITDLYDIVNTLSVIPTIMKPTRLTENSYTLIDNILISKPINYVFRILAFEYFRSFPYFCYL